VTTAFTGISTELVPGTEDEFLKKMVDPSGQFKPSAYLEAA
jgi:hypothetical protein